MSRYEDIAGSGRLRVTTRTDVARAVKQTEMLERVGPIEGTNVSLWNTQIPNWWAENVYGTALYGTPQLADRVWVANRCIQLNAQQIASMPLEWHGPPSATEPAWVSNPDPNWFPNGVSSAIFALVDQYYRWGFSCQYVTDRYADGFPRTWTVLDSARINISADNGFREYKYGETELDPRRVVQIDRNPGLALHGSSALRAYAQQAWGLLAASNQAMSINNGAIPSGIVKSHRKLKSGQAETIQEKWMNPRIPGAPRVLGPELDWVPNAFSPEDLALLESQEWNARNLATAFGTPSVILNMALQGGLTYQNPLALMQMWWLTELRTTAKAISDAFSAQMLPSQQWVSIDASDITTEVNADDDPQLSQVAKASPAQQTQTASRPLTAIGSGG